ncbi:hypothetical protein D3C81_1307020 [compost metagenome]
MITQHQPVPHRNLGEDDHLVDRVLEHRRLRRSLLLLLLDVRGIHLHFAAVGLLRVGLDHLQCLQRTVVAYRVLGIGLDGAFFVDQHDAVDIKTEAAVLLHDERLRDLFQGD